MLRILEDTAAQAFSDSHRMSPGSRHSWDRLQPAGMTLGSPSGGAGS